MIIVEILAITRKVPLIFFCLIEKLSPLKEVVWLFEFSLTYSHVITDDLLTRMNTLTTDPVAFVESWKLEESILVTIQCDIVFYRTLVSIVCGCSHYYEIDKWRRKFAFMSHGIISSSVRSFKSRLDQDSSVVYINNSRTRQWNYCLNPIIPHRIKSWLFGWLAGWLSGWLARTITTWYKHETRLNGHEGRD